MPDRRAQRSASAGAASATGRRARAEIPIRTPTPTAFPPRAATANAPARKSIDAEWAANQARPSTLEKRSVVPNAERTAPASAYVRGAPYARSPKYKIPADAPPANRDATTCDTAVGKDGTNGRDRIAASGG